MFELDRILKLDSLRAAPLLLGWQIVRDLPGGRVRLRIVETEAYHQDDPASHSFRGRTVRTAPMFESGGHIYVYFSYGVHYCINIVTGQAGRGEGVLLRAAEPLEGIEIMKSNRGLEKIENLASGPGKLAQALGVRDTSLSGTRLGRSSLWLEPPRVAVKPRHIVIGPRVGITKAAEAEARFYIKGSKFVSKI
ncbi:MAG TPA: DNA-3-methyladenine glycosylase [Candidatus Saccharimonadales bacterium]|nr:DNA-3-methyladenine glycosylase [Candidatus Saccharimonadales bacterium]